MTTDDDAVLAVVDARGRVAAVALRDRIERALPHTGALPHGDGTPGAFPQATSLEAGIALADDGAAGTQRRNRRVRVVLAAAAIVLLVGAAAAVVDRDEPSTVASGTPELVAGWLPPGMTAASAVRVGGRSAEAPDAVGGDMVVYGDGSTDDPWSASTLRVTIVEGAPDPGEAGERITVAGHPAVVEQTDGISVSWDTDGGRVVVAGSADLDRATVVAAAEGADPSPSIAPGALPEGYVEIGRGSLDAMMGAGGPGYIGREEGLVLGYASGDPSDPGAVVGVFQRPGVDGSEDLVRLTSARTRPGEVRGRHAVVGDSGSGPQTPEPFVQWREPSGLITTVSGIGIDERTLLRIAEGLRPAEPGEIDRLAEATPDVGTPTEQAMAAETSDGEVIATGAHEGEPWRLVLTDPDDDGSRRLELSYRDGAGAVGWSRGEPMPPVLHGSSSAASWTSPVVYGLVKAGVRVTIELAGGHAIVPEVTPVDGEAFGTFVTWLPAGEAQGVETVVAVDALGAEVYREVAGAPESGLSSGSCEMSSDGAAGTCTVPGS